MPKELGCTELHVLGRDIVIASTPKRNLVHSLAEKTVGCNLPIKLRVTMGKQWGNVPIDLRRLYQLVSQVGHTGFSL